MKTIREKFEEYSKIRAEITSLKNSGVNNDRIKITKIN